MPVITNAGEYLITQQQQAGEPLIIDQMILANITGLDSNTVPSREQSMPAPEDVKIIKPITKDGLLNTNTVVYSTVFPSTDGTFDFNYMGLYSSAHDVIVAVAYVPLQTKIKTVGTDVGNVITKNFAIEFNAAADITGINISAESWQIDYTARLMSMDKHQRDLVKNIYGPSTFLNDAFKVKFETDKYYLTAGKAILGGINFDLEADLEIVPGALPKTVWLDVYQETSMMGVLNKHDVVINDGTVLTDYVAGSVEHTLVKLGVVNSSVDIVDGRSLVKRSLELTTKNNDPKNVAELRKARPEYAGQKLDIDGHTLPGIGGGPFYHDPDDSTSPDNNGTVIVNEWGDRWRRNNGGIKNTREFGAIGNYDPLTDTGSDDTLAMQSLFDSLEDGDTIVMEGSVLIDRDSAEIKTVNGVDSYICVADSINDLKITGTGKLYQRHHETKDAVGVLLNKCDDLFLDMPIFDGNFKYTDSTPLNFKQQLLHIVECKRSRGGFTVKNSSNIGFLISNEYTVSGATKNLNNSSVFHTVISENCLQNSTYGAGVQKVVINTLIIKNPIVGGIKFSSRIDSGAGVIFEGFRIDNVLASFDEGYVNPMRYDNSAPNDALAILDNVCQAEKCSIGFAYLDFSGVSIPAIGAKHVSRDSTLFGNQPNGLLIIDHLLIKNMVNGLSQCVIVDAQAEGTRIKTLEVENVAGGVQVYQVEANAAIQPKKNKFIDIGEIIAKGNTKALFNADGYDADYIRIGRVKQDFKATAQQAINISGSCNLNVVELVDLDITDSVSINGTVNNRIIVKGVVDTSLQDKSPISVNLASKGSDLEYDVNVVGDLGADKKVYINNVNTVSFYKHCMRGCPSGFVLNNIDLVNIADTSPNHEDITALQAWTFNPSVLKIQGTVQNTGSPSGTLVASAGLIYKRTDENQDAAAKLYIKIKDIEAGERNLGWRTFLTS